MRKRVLALHWEVITFGAEINTPQEYSEAELCRFNKKYEDMLREFWWMMEVLGDQCPGDGMAIPKVHAMSNPGTSIFDYGSLVNGDSSTFERLMRDLKDADERIDQSRANDGALKLLCNIVANERNAENSALLPFLPNPLLTNTARVTIAGTEVLGSGHSWLSLVHSLQRGENGPIFDQKLLESTKTFLETEVPTSHAHVSARTFVYSRTCALTEAGKLHGETNVRLLSSGHCIELHDGRFAQVIAPNAHDREAPPTKEADVVLLVGFFVYHNHSSPKHPELPVVWLKRKQVRCSLGMVPLAHVRRRAHVIALFKGGEHDSPCEPLPQSFLVNDMVHPYRAAPKTRKVFMSCGTMGCTGRLQQPEVHGAVVRCELCTEHYPWL
jgi:hypothetical protein